MRRLRQKLPRTERFDDVETRILQNRHSAFKNKAQKLGQKIPWPAFNDFFAEVLSVAPTDYTPSRYHLQWGEEGGDYRLEALKFKRVFSSRPEEVTVELAILLAGLEPQQEGDSVNLSDLINVAAINAAA